MTSDPTSIFTASNGGIDKTLTQAYNSKQGVWMLFKLGVHQEIKTDDQKQNRKDEVKNMNNSGKNNSSELLFMIF